MGIYKANDNHKLLDTTKITYKKEISLLRIYYSPNIASNDKRFRKRWVVAVPGQFVRIRSSEPDASVHCPSKAKGWQYWKEGRHRGFGEWVTDLTISITCLPETSTSATVPKITNEENTTVPKHPTKPWLKGIHNNVIIGASVGCGVFCLVIVAFCAFYLCKRRNTNLERDNMVDENPVYMYDYADPDENNEIYDTNAYYGVTDVDTEGSTVATDLNPDYE